MKLVGTVGFEPTTFRLSIECSNQLSYAPMKMEPDVRFELTTDGLQNRCSTNWANLALVDPIGVETMTYRLWVGCSDQLSYIPRNWSWVNLYCLTSHPARFDEHDASSFRQTSPPTHRTHWCTACRAVWLFRVSSFRNHQIRCGKESRSIYNPVIVLVEGGPDLIVGLSCNANKDSAFYFALLTWGLLSLGTYYWAVTA